VTPALPATTRRALGPTGLSVTGICIGTSSWSSEAVYHAVAPTEAETDAAADRLFDGPLNFADTSNNYGGGESERRIGRAIARRGLPDDFVLQTKLDRDMQTGEFTGRRVRRSLEESLERLGLSRLPIVYLHDPEHTTFESAMAADGPVPEMIRMRDEGIVGALGVSGGPVDLLQRFVDTDVFDAVITHNRYTLLERSAEPLIAQAHAKGLGVLNAAPYGGGLLSTYPPAVSSYGYRPASDALMAEVHRMGSLLAAHGVPLAAAALQFSLRDPRITSTIVGAPTAHHIDATLELAAIPIPDALWDELLPR